MVVVGITGQSGAGKGEASKILASLGFSVIDADAVYHNVIFPPSRCLDELVFHFGRGILTAGGLLNRQTLAGLVFGEENKEKLQLLNEITHKHILNAVRREIESLKLENAVDGIIIDAPLLFESGFDKECDLTMAVIANIDTKIERIIARDGITREHAEARLSSQISDSELVARCDHIIENNGDAHALREEVHRLKKIIFG